MSASSDSLGMSTGPCYHRDGWPGNGYCLSRCERNWFHQGSTWVPPLRIAFRTLRSAVLVRYRTHVLGNTREELANVSRPNRTLSAAHTDGTDGFHL